MSASRAEHLLDCFLSACMDTKQVTGGEMFDAMLSRLFQAVQQPRDERAEILYPLPAKERQS